MKTLKLTNEELKLIEFGLRNIATTGEDKTISNLRNKIKLKCLENDNETEAYTITTTLELDTSKFEDNLKRLGEKLLAISRI